jgi:Tfp pilus assembly protein PilN
MVSRPVGERSSGKKIRTGVAISPTELIAADVRLRGAADRAWRTSLDAPPTDGGAWPSLAAALSDLSQSLGITDGRLAVSLLPPLTEVRRVELPPASAEDTHRLLARNAARYFVNARGPQIVGALASGRKVRGVPTPTVAAAASARLVAAIRAAAAQSGWTIESLAPAEGAWAGAAVTLWPAFGKQNAWMLIAHDDRTDLLELDGGRLAGLRRFRAGSADAALIADALGPAARVGIAGAPAVRRELSSALSAHGITVLAAAGEWSTIAEHADLLAAHFAGSETGPILRGEDAVVFDRVRSRKAAWTMAGAAAALLIVAATVELWGVHRQLRLVQAERARLRPEIASTMVGRTTVEATYRHLTALNGIERTAPHWSAVIAALSDAVPDDAHLTAIRARDDSLIIDGLAQHAARVFDGLEKTNGLVDVKAPAPVRREIQDDGTPLDHFTIAARVAPPKPASASRPVSGPGPGTRPTP